MSNRKRLITCLFNRIRPISFLWTQSGQSIVTRRGHWPLALNDMLRGSGISEGWCHRCHQQLCPEWHLYYSVLAYKHTAGLMSQRHGERMFAGDEKLRGYSVLFLWFICLWIIEWMAEFILLHAARMHDLFKSQYDFSKTQQIPIHLCYITSALDHFMTNLFWKSAYLAIREYM